MNQKERWEKQHWITQKVEDIDLKPSGCPWCGDKDQLKEDHQGWICKTCLMQINGVSYYQGANAKAKKLGMVMP